MSALWEIVVLSAVKQYRFIDKYVIEKLGNFKCHSSTGRGDMHIMNVTPFSFYTLKPIVGVKCRHLFPDASLGHLLRDIQHVNGDVYRLAILQRDAHRSARDLKNILMRIDRVIDKT